MNVEAEAALAPGPAIGGLHDAASRSRDHLKTRRDQGGGKLLGQPVGGAVRGASRRAEHRDLAGGAVGLKHRNRLLDILKGATDQ